jgi:hypothetical protein
MWLERRTAVLSGERWLQNKAVEGIGAAESSVASGVDWAGEQARKAWDDLMDLS